jgi:hypothetical protein
MQPFVSYATPTAWSYTFNTESTYDWENRQWAVPVNAVVAKITRLGLSAWAAADGPDSGPHALGPARDADTAVPALTGKEAPT